MSSDLESTQGESEEQLYGNLLSDGTSSQWTDQLSVTLPCEGVRSQVRWDTPDGASWETNGTPRVGPYLGWDVSGEARRVGTQDVCLGGVDWHRDLHSQHHKVVVYNCHCDTDCCNHESSPPNANYC